MVVTGRLNKQVAFQLGISEKTVNLPRAPIMQKLHGQSGADLVGLAEKIKSYKIKV